MAVVACSRNGSSTGAARGNESAFGDANLEKEEEKAEDEVVVDTIPKQ